MCSVRKEAEECDTVGIHQHLAPLDTLVDPSSQSKDIVQTHKLECHCSTRTRPKILNIFS